MIYRFFNQGEVPALACGWRTVIALPPGRKWITLVDWTTLETAAIEISTWSRLKPVEYPLNHRKVKAQMRDRLQYKEVTQAIRDAMELVTPKKTPEAQGALL